jgi:hypothetical protein
MCAFASLSLSRVTCAWLGTSPSVCISVFVYALADGGGVWWVCLFVGIFELLSQKVYVEFFPLHDGSSKSKQERPNARYAVCLSLSLCLHTNTATVCLCVLV